MKRFPKRFSVGVTETMFDELQQLAKINQWSFEQAARICMLRGIESAYLSIRGESRDRTESPEPAPLNQLSIPEIGNGSR